MKKYLNLPLAYHGALFLAMLILQLMQNNVLSIVVLLELCGIIISPVFMAVLAMINAIVNEEKVHVMFSGGIVRLFVIGMVRVLIYFIFAKSTILFALGAMVVSVALFCLWEAIFAITDKLMKKRPGRKGKYRK